MGHQKPPPRSQSLRRPPRRHLPRRPLLPRRLFLLRRLPPRRALPRRPPRRALPRRSKFVSYGSSDCEIWNDLNVERPVSISNCKRAFPFFFQFVTCLVVESFRYSCLI